MVLPIGFPGELKITLKTKELRDPDEIDAIGKNKKVNYMHEKSP